MNILPNMTGFMTGVGRGLQGLAPRMAHVGRGMTRFLTLPLIGAGVAVTSLAKNFERSMQEIVGLTGTSQKQVDKWSKQILDLAGKLPQTPQELAEAMYFVASSGVAASVSMDVLKASAQAAAGGLGETQTVADAVTSAINAYGEANLKAKDATDILVNAVRLGKAEASSFTPVLGSVLPTASELRIEFHEVAGAIAAMTRTGDSAATAATKVNAVMSALIKPTDASQKAIKKLDISFQEMQEIVGNKGLFPALIQLRDAIREQGGSWTEQNEILADLFPNVRALRGVLSLTGTQAEKNAVVFDKMANSAGLTNDALKAVSDTADFKFKKAMASLQAEAIKLGNILIPILVDDIIPAIQKAVKWFGNLSDEQKENVLKWAAIIAVAGPLLRILSPMVRVVGALVSGFGKLAGALAGAAAANAGGAVAGTFQKIAGLKVPVVGATSAITGGAGAAGAGLTPALLSIGSAGVLAAIALTVGAIISVKSEAKKAEERINGMVGAFRKGKAPSSLSETAESAAALQARVDAITAKIGTAASPRGPGVPRALTLQLEEAQEALRRYRKEIQDILKPLDLSTRNQKFLNDAINEAEGVSKKQIARIAGMVNGLEAMGGSLTKQERYLIAVRLKMGDFAGAMDVVKPKLDAITEKLAKRYELKIDTSRARGQVESFLSSLEGRDVTVGVRFVGGADFVLTGGGRGGVQVVPRFGDGAIVMTRQIAEIAEKGPEAVVPLDEWERRRGGGGGSGDGTLRIVDSNLDLVMDGVVGGHTAHRRRMKRTRR